MRKLNIENSLMARYPELSREWNYEKNGVLTPWDVSYGCNKRVWWKCSDGHEWMAVVNNRIRSQARCPYCRGRRLISGQNSLADINPKLASEWHPSKNGLLRPDKIRANDNRHKVWWKCEKGHEWQQTVGYRNYNNVGCPICSKERYTSFPEKAIFYYIKQYYPDAVNNDKSFGVEIDIFIPSLKVAVEYDGNVWHEYQEEREQKKNALCKELGIELIRIREVGLTVYDDCITIQRDGFTDASLDDVIRQLLSILIPNCVVNVNVKLDKIAILSSYVISNKKDSISLLRPDLAKDWHPVKNGSLTPDMVSAGSSWNVWWICKEGHEWNTSVANRASGKGCPICGRKIVGKKLSTPDGNDIASLYPELVEEWDYENNNGITPQEVITGSNKKFWWKCKKCGGRWSATPGHRTLRGSGCPYCSGQKVLSGYNDLASVYPELIKEWDYTLNDSLTPQNITAGSGKKVWWICKEGHQWLASICNRIKGRGCPYCSNKKIIVGENDLGTTHKELVEEWDFEKNIDISPQTFVAGSNKSVWWRCNKGHSWKAVISSRALNGNGCPYCSNRKVLGGYNDLLSTDPEIVVEWDYEKNGSLTPQMVSRGSDKIVWWKCGKGHGWKAMISNRSKGEGCPICKHKSIICIETGIIYNTLEEASVIAGVSKSTLGRYIRDKKASAGGYHWEYV